MLVQTNFGGVLQINGAPVGKELGRYYLKNELEGSGRPTADGRRRANDQRPTANDSPDGSCMIVVATDAPVDARNLRRLAARAILGLARTGSSGSNGSGDYVIAFSTAPELRVQGNAGKPAAPVLGNEAMSPLFEAAIEATEEAIYNSLFKATTTTGRGHTVEALPLDRTLEILRAHKLLSH